MLLQFRAGSNVWWCIAPCLYPPGPAVPMCGDAVALDWLQAWTEEAEPTPGAPGIIYALAGGRDASPFKARSDGNLPGIETGPMVIVVNPPEAELALFRTTERPDTSAPYVMWPDRPFAHLPRPVE